MNVANDRTDYEYEYTQLRRDHVPVQELSKYPIIPPDVKRRRNTVRTVKARRKASAVKQINTPVIARKLLYLSGACTV
jgi:hypothetical protein